MKLRAPLLVGLVLIASTVTLTWFVTSTSKDKFDEDSTYPLVADFRDAAGIRWKTRVQINGIDVGKIETIEHERDDAGRLVARVRLRVLDKYDVYTNAYLRKAAESLLGDFRLDFDPGGTLNWCSRREPCPDGSSCDEGRCIRKCQSAVHCPAEMECTEEICQYRRLVTEGAPCETHEQCPPYAACSSGVCVGLVSNVQSVSDLDEIQSQLKDVAGNVNDVTDSLKRVLAGPEGEGSLKSILSRVERSMEAIERSTATLSDMLRRNDRNIDHIITNLEGFTSNLADTTGHGGDVDRILANVATISGRLDRIAESLEGMVGEDYAATEQANLRSTINGLNESIDNLAAISRKINEGQGTVGRVVNDPGIADKIEQTLDDTSELIGGLSRLQTKIELRSQYEVPFGRDNELVQSAIKNTLALKLQPKPDKYYIIEAIADPRGTQQRRIVTEQTEDADGKVTSTQKTEETTISFNDLKFSAQFAKRYYFVTLRFGIIENTGGLGMNLHALEDDLEFRLDMFDFDRRDPDPANNNRIFPRLRTTAMYNFVTHLALQGGIDDPFNKRLRTWFLGGVLSFTDDDLKALLTVAPSP